MTASSRVYFIAANSAGRLPCLPLVLVVSVPHCCLADTLSGRIAWVKPGPGGGNPHTSICRYTAAVRNVTAASEAVQQDGAPRPTHFTKYPLTQASTPKGLTFKAGRPVVVLRQEPTGWWWVSIDGAEGEAPANYLEEGGGANGSPIEHSPTAVELRALRDAGVLTDVQLGSLAMMHTDLEAYTNGWISATLRLLESLKMVPGAELVMVTNSELAPAMAKTLLFRLGKYFSAENIYSSATIGKRAGFDLIRARYRRMVHSRIRAPITPTLGDSSHVVVIFTVHHECPTLYAPFLAIMYPNFVRIVAAIIQLSSVNAQALPIVWLADARAAFFFWGGGMEKVRCSMRIRRIW